MAKSTGDDPKIYRIAHEFIYRSEIDVEDVLDGYCYDSLEEMREIYGDKTDQALAECQFEFDASGGDNLIARMPLMTWEEAKETIEKMINIKSPSWKVVMVSGRETKKDFSSDYPTEKEAEEFAASLDWRYIDENQFEWGLEVEED